MADIISFRPGKGRKGQLMQMMEDTLKIVNTSRTGKNFTKNELIIDAITAYCIGVLSNKLPLNQELGTDSKEDPVRGDP